MEFQRDFALDLTEYIKFKGIVEETKKIGITDGLLTSWMDFSKIMEMNRFGEIFSLKIDMSLIDKADLG